MESNTLTEIIEVAVNNIGIQKFILGTLPSLRDAKNIRRIESFPVSQITIAPSGKALVNATVFQKAFIKLVNSAQRDVGSYPLLSLSKYVNGTVIPEINVGSIDPEKSMIELGSSAGLVLDEVFLLLVTYDK